MNKSRTTAKYVVVTRENDDQRIDNFLMSQLRGVPRSHVYRILRKGEVRVNKKRIHAFYRLKVGDSVRIPPLFLAEQAALAPPSQATTDLLKERILYEDENLIILNKPSGMSVHVGSTVRIGVIEAFRHIYPKLPNIELAHRLDSETSGCLILAKRKSILRELHTLLRAGQITKIYWALTQGTWKKSELCVDLALRKDYQPGGKHVVSVNQEGKSAQTEFHTLKNFKHASLMEVKLLTGRTHQIRVHAAHLGHPIAGDDRYGDTEFNKWIHSIGLRRMFLHAHSVDFTLPSTNRHIKVVAPLDEELEHCIEVLNGKIMKG